MILGLENVSKTFSRSRRKIEALNNVSLQLGRGDFVGVLGPGGAGKTTLLRLAAGLESPDSGSVTYEGRSLSDMSKAEVGLYRRREVSCIWGSNYLNPGLSILDNVALPLLLDGGDRRGTSHGAREQLIAVRAEHFIDARPDELSDAERQRASIAQALVTKPRLLLADEPASNLDLYEQDSLLSLLQSLARDSKMAVLIADTDATALMRARPILYLRDGELLSERPPEKRGQIIDLPKGRSSREESSDA